MISSGVVEVQNLQVGDRVKGIDENGSDADECEVVSVTRYDTHACIMKLFMPISHYPSQKIITAIIFFIDLLLGGQHISSAYPR